MTNTIKRFYWITGFAAGALVVTALALYLSGANLAVGEAPSGLAAQVHDVQFVAVGMMGVDSPVVIFDENRSCTSRIISTGSTTVRIITASSTFSGVATSTNYLNNARGIIQAASTTVAYDSGIYGCGYWGAIGYAPTTTLTVIENN